VDVSMALAFPHTILLSTQPTLSRPGQLTMDAPLNCSLGSLPSIIHGRLSMVEINTFLENLLTYSIKLLQSPRE
jgi:hypothetical protein